MASRWIRIDPTRTGREAEDSRSIERMRDGLRAIRAEAEVPESFPAEVEREAEAVAAGGGSTVTAEGRERSELPFVTIDPPGSRDLDQAMHIERRGDGHRVSYAIADVAAFVAPASALDAEAHRRAVTVYAPDEKAPLHPPVLSEGAASLLPGEWRPTVLWTFDLDGRGEPVETTVVRAEVRSVAQHTYDDVPSELAALLREVGARRLALEEARGGVRLAVPEQEVEREGDGWTVRYRETRQVEDDNAQVSLLTGMEAARLMLAAGVGILRTQAPPGERELRRFRLQVKALGVDWPAGTSYPELIRSLDPTVPVHAALMHEATGVGRGAGYVAFDGEVPRDHAHFSIAADYAHATAPLRRLQDRYVSECCLAACAGERPPEWVRAGLEALPKAMSAGGRRAGAVERGVVDLVEAMLLEGRVGESFAGMVIDSGMLQLREPAVRAHLDEPEPEPKLGSEVSARLISADPVARRVEFALAS